MPLRTIATLAVAILLGLAAVFLARTWLGQQRASDAEQAVVAGTTPVLVASQPIPRGGVLSPTTNLKLVRYPQGSVPTGALTTLEQATEGGERLALRPIGPNEPILVDKITTPGGRVNLSAAMTAGMRAVTFRSNEVAGVAGFVLPGDRVDVLLTRDASAGTGEGAASTITQVLAENIKVLGVDQIADEFADEPVVARAITLEMTPDQAQKISLAQSVGSVSLALRQISDEAPVGRKVTSVADLGFFRVRTPPRAAPAAAVIAAPAGPAGSAPPPPPDGKPIRVTRGTDTKTYYVDR